jgi:hypothetical protein
MSVYNPNRTRREGSAFAARMEKEEHAGAYGIRQVGKVAEAALDRGA